MNEIINVNKRVKSEAYFFFMVALATLFISCWTSRRRRCYVYVWYDCVHVVAHMWSFILS